MQTLGISEHNTVEIGDGKTITRLKWCEFSGGRRQRVAVTRRKPWILPRADRRRGERWEPIQMICYYSVSFDAARYTAPA